MTATPRVYNFSGTTQPEAYSMDNPSNFGRICAKMSFAEAVALDIICHYKTIVSVIDTNSLQLNLLDNGVLSDTEISVRDVAIRDSILQAMKKYDVKKVISYHSTIEQAETFVSSVIKDSIDGYEKLHISSGMTGKQRYNVMERFRKAERAIITNARCLTEGIDVPAADMVVFADPKCSEIDIVQAVGRVMRVSEGKTAGYVFLPLFLDQRSGESIAEALNRNRYETTWKVLYALCSVDSDLESQMAIYRQGLERGRDPWPPIIDILTQPGVDAEKIRESVGIFIVRRLSDVWEEYYGALLRFWKEHGNIHMTHATSLSKWLSYQRSSWKTLALEKQKRLLALGFDLCPLQTAWEKKYEELRAFKEQYGHMKVSSTQLQGWIRQQRKRWDVLSAENRALLLELEFDPDPMETSWQKRIEELRAYAKVHGHCNARKEESLSLANFLWRMRHAYHEGKLAQD